MQWAKTLENYPWIMYLVGALITVRFIIQAIHKSILGEEAPGC